MKHNIKIIEPQLHGQSKKIIIDGRIYNSFNEFRCYNRISESQITKCKKEMDCSLEEIIDFLLCKKEKEQEEREIRISKENERYNSYIESHEFIYKEVPYESFASAIRQLNSEGYALTASYISSIAKKENISKQQAIDLFLERRKIRNEKEYNEYISKQNK